jgi:hypothetical protein
MAQGNVTTPEMSPAEVIAGFRKLGCQLQTTEHRLYVPLDKAWNDSPEFRALCEALNRPDMHRAVVARLRCGTMAVGEL